MLLLVSFFVGRIFLHFHSCLNFFESILLSLVMLSYDLYFILRQVFRVKLDPKASKGFISQSKKVARIVSLVTHFDLLV